MKKILVGSIYFTSRLSAKFIFYSAFVLLVFAAFSQPAAAQEKPPEDLVPPPLILVSKGEGERLDAAADARKRTDLSLELIEARIMKAEKLSGEQQFAESLVEIGGFQGIILNLVKYLERNRTGSKSLKSFKTLEISLRSYTPRVEIMRREMPPKFGYHLRSVLKFIRETRTRATDKLFDENFSPDKK